MAETNNQKPKIVIVGGGASGLELATKLGRKLGRKGRAEVTLLDAASTHIWKPLLHEVAAGTLDESEQVEYLAGLCEKYPIVSVEDGCSEDDWDTGRHARRYSKEPAMSVNT